MYIVKRKDRLFVHYGIFISNDKVIHYASETNNMFSHNQCVRVSTLNEFSINRRITLYEIKNNISFDEIYYRAYLFSQNGKKYNVFNNNCVSFILSILDNKRNIGFIEMIIWVIKYHFHNPNKITV